MARTPGRSAEELAISDEQKKHLGDRRVYVSVSGGKDSNAVCLWLRENGIPFQAIAADTGWESPVTYKYIKEELPRIAGEITWVRSSETLQEKAIRKAMFPTGKYGKYCTKELKIDPLIEFFSDMSANGDCDFVNAVGVRREEGKRKNGKPKKKNGKENERATATEWEWQDGFDCEIWRPLVDWTFDDVVEIHLRHNFQPNPLYLLGVERVGCWPCIYATKSEIEIIARTDPDRIEEIRRLEKIVGDERERREAEKGKTLKNRPTFFQAKIPEKDENGKLRYPCWPIDKVVQWAKTERGGRQFGLFAPPIDAGCSRWGMCEAPIQGEEEEEELIDCSD